MQKFMKNSRWGYIVVHAFSKGFSPEVNVVVRLDFDLTYYDVAVYLFKHNSTGTPPKNL